jgi:hypothetical protein
MKFRLFVVFLAVVALAMGACGLQDPSVSVSSPRGGETYRIGEDVTVRWGCEGCAGVIGEAKIALLPAGSEKLLGFASGPVPGSMEWRAGSVEQGTVPPGRYQIVVYADCDFSSEVRSCIARTGTFQLVR